MTLDADDQAPHAAASVVEAMRFDHERKHSLNDLAEFAAFDSTKPVDTLLAFRMADSMVTHGHPKTQPLLDALAKITHSDVASYIAGLERCHAEITRRFKLSAVDRQFLRAAYHPRGHILLKKSRPTNNLLVLFSTMYNNFYMSNAVILTMMQELDCHILYLKDSTIGNYHLGVHGFAADFPGIATKIQEVAAQVNASKIFFSGFSSGGYAAMLTSLQIPSAGYLGFSQDIDLSPESTQEPNRYFTPEVRAWLDPRWLLDLRKELEKSDPGVPRWLYYGGKMPRDKGHALHLEGVAGIEVVCLPDSRHETVLDLMAAGEFLDLFRRLLAEG